MEKTISVDLDAPLERVGWHILAGADVNMARVAALVREHGTAGALAAILAYLNQMDVAVVSADDVPYDPAEAVRAAVEQIAPASGSV